MARICIYGDSNHGMYLGGFLHLAGSNVCYVGSDWLKTEIDSSDAVTVSDNRGREYRIPQEEIQYLTDIAELVGEKDSSPENDVPLDFLILTVKARETEEAVRKIAHLDGGKVVVVSFQNGPRNAEVIKKLMPNTTVIAGMVPFNVAHLPNAHFHQASLGPIYLEDGDEASTLAQILIDAGLQTCLTADIRGIIYGKLLIALNNAIGALSGLPFRNELSEKSYRQVLAQCITEALSCYGAAGIMPLSFSSAVPPWTVPYILRLPDFMFFQIAGGVLGVDDRAMSTMYEDLLLRRPTDVDALNGEILRLGIEHGVPTPCNKVLIDLIKDIEKTNQAHFDAGSEHINGNSLNGNPPVSYSGEELLKRIADSIAPK
ncbi:hypothetical protein HK102_013275 [Quaeritorhiza haematococci]|nr:hypothetical protein HK102_013275 [Quaeritorhiza haematococci]